MYDRRYIDGTGKSGDKDMMNAKVKKRKNRTAVILFLSVFTVVLLAAALIAYFYPYLEGYRHQEQEKSIAVHYLEDLQNNKAGTKERDIDWEQIAERASKLAEKNTDGEEASKGRWSDDTYYELDGVTYTPDYAQGTLDCVLIIPKIQLCRGVYTGTWEDITHNLDVWMATTARPDYVLGETHYCIYGHNTPRLNLSFNRLQSLEAGDAFYLVNPDGVYEYRVTDILGVSRSESSRYTDDFTISSKKCYLITCGRDEYRYLDLIVEGTLKSLTPIDEVDMDELFLE